MTNVIPFKLGRKARTYHPAVPHLSALRAGAPSSAPPASVNNTVGLPTDLGQMLNNTLGDCTCAGYYHALQVWSVAAGKACLTEPDGEVEALYEACGGYVPGDPSTDNGCVEQDVLQYLLNTGAPMAAGSPHKLLAFYEVDSRNLDDVRWTICDCALAYIGFEVPAYLMETLTAPGSVWGLPGEAGIPANADTTIEGGHCIILPGYQPAGNFAGISWGSAGYQLTPGFIGEFVDEIYGLLDGEYLLATGKTPGGLTIAQWQQQVKPLQILPPDQFRAQSRSDLQWQINLGVHVNF